MRIGIVDKGGAGRVPPSAAIRAHRRGRHVRDATVRRIDAAAYGTGKADRVDVLLVVRDALGSHHVESVLRRVSSEGSRLVVDLDDDLLSGPARERLVAQGYSDERLDALACATRAADRVLVSTQVLADVVHRHVGREASVLPNELDPLLWAGDLAGGPPPAPTDEIRLLYMGSRTHDQDLALLRGVPSALTARTGRPVVLEVVGVTKGPLPAGMRRIQPANTLYPGFVRWLRWQAPRWHAGVAPLAPDPFNLCKSDLKLLEYAALGLPCVATPIGPYAAAPALLATHAGTEQEWVDRLTTTVTGTPGEGPAGRDWVLEHRGINAASIEHWVRLLAG